MESLYVFCLTKPIADTQAELVALNNSCERATGGRDNRFIDGPAGEANLSCSSLYLTRRVRNTGAQIKHAALLPAPARRRTPVRCALGHLLCSARRAAYAKRRSLSRELPSFSRSPSATGRRRQIAGHRWPAAPVNDRLYSRLVAGSRPQEGKRASSWPLRGHCVGNESPGSQLLMNTNCASRRTLMNSASIARSLARTKPSSSDTHVKLPRSLARNVIVVNGDHASRLAR